MGEVLEIINMFQYVSMRRGLKPKSLLLWLYPSQSFVVFGKRGPIETIGLHHVFIAKLPSVFRVTLYRLTLVHTKIHWL